MLLCFFLRAEESKNMARLCLAKGGISPSRVKTLQDATFTQGYNNSYTFRAPPVNVAIKRAESDAHIDYPERE